MDDPAERARALRGDAAFATGTYEVPAEDLPPDTDDGWVAAGALVRTPDGDQYVLVRTHWSGEDWVLPGGGVEPADESLAATARREVREETGLDISVEEPLLVERQTLVGAGAPDRRTTGWFVLFACTATTEGLDGHPGEHEDEIVDVGWFGEPEEAFGGPSDAVRDAVRDECG